MKITVRKILYYLTGSLVLTIGISLSVKSALGAGAFDALNSNLSVLLGISLGKAMGISVAVLFVITLLLKPRWIYIFGVMLTFFTAIELDFFAWLLPAPGLYAFRVLYFGLALVLLPLGIAFIIKSKMPLSPMDNLLVILTGKTKWSVSLVKLLIETSFVVAALIIGLLAGIGLGNISIGTVIITLAIGPGTGIFMKHVKDVDWNRIV